jgi:type IV fimbrial biogenesis protein FimT
MIAPAGSQTARRPRGFTLIELMVTVATAAILTSIALPAMRTFFQNDRLWTEQNSIVLSLNAARSEAIKQNASVSVCPSSDGATCNNSSAWANGWVVLASTAGSAPIQSVPALPTGNTLTEASSLTAVTFLSNGMVQAAAAFKFCDSRGGSQARYTQVMQYGRVLSAPTVGKNLGGAGLSCP